MAHSQGYGAIYPAIGVQKIGKMYQSAKYTITSVFYGPKPFLNWKNGLASYKCQFALFMD